MDSKRLRRAVFMCVTSIIFAIAPTMQAGEPNRDAIDKASTDYVGIIRAVEYYFEAGRTGDTRFMKEVFLPEANIYSNRDGIIVGGPIQLLYDSVEGKPSSTEIVYTITAINISGVLSTVHLKIDNWSGNAYIDMFTMIKGDNGWKIASKVSCKQ